MRRNLSLAPLLALGLLAFGLPGLAPGRAEAAPGDEPAPAAETPETPEAAPVVLATDEEADAAVEAFKDAWKAKGLKGDERLAQRDWAMQQLASIQHPEVVDELAKVLRGSDENLRIAAAVHLSTQTGLPVLAGRKVAEAIARNKSDVTFVMAALDTLGRLKYLGASDVISDMLRHPDFSVKKAAIEAVGNTGDVRLLKDMLKQVGIDADKPPKEETRQGGQEQKEEGYSWEGAEATVDTGSAGDGDQKEAERQAKEKAEKNKADAERKAGGGGGMDGGSTGSGVNKPGKGGGGRSPKELIHAVKRALGVLTGEEFDSALSVHVWVAEHEGEIGDLIKAVCEAEKQQAKDEKEAVKAPR